MKEMLMFKRNSRLVLALLAASIAVAPAHAQLAVIDVPAIAQLIQEVQALSQQVQTAENQLAQAKQALTTMTGTRGMELLLSGMVRNYLPTDWQQLVSAMQGVPPDYPALSANVQSAVAANAVLNAQQLSALSAGDRQQILARRQTGALQQALAQVALSNASQRFAAIQTLINAISTATDQKGVLDLQARISAELGMLENEQTKLQVFGQAMQAQAAVETQQERELAVASQGNFATRFQPTP
jgi:type IV secretion system protein VirB5